MRLIRYKVYLLLTGFSLQVGLYRNDGGTYLLILEVVNSEEPSHLVSSSTSFSKSWTNFNQFCRQIRLRYPGAVLLHEEDHVSSSRKELPYRRIKLIS